MCFRVPLSACRPSDWLISYSDRPPAAAGKWRMYACVLLAAIVQQSRGYLNPFFFFFDWAAAAGLGSSLFFYLARPVVFFAQMRSLFQPSAPIPPSCSSSHRPRFSPVEISFGTEYFSGRQSHGYSPARFSLSRLLSTPIFSDGTFL